MRRSKAPSSDIHGLAYARACAVLARMALRRGPARGVLGKGARRKAGKFDTLERDLAIAGLELDARTVRLAGKGLGTLSAAASVATLGILYLLSIETLVVPLVFAAIVLPFICKQLFVSHASSLAKRRARDVLKGSPESVNLMIMSLRHGPSLSKAIAFASTKDSPFSSELRRCTWEVVMGIHKDFEGALYALGKRWKDYGGELKDSIGAMITASLEGTEDGKRRALDRANAAMVTGTKRRIEEYALSLSSPSMIMFGVGILLPLMVGSFLPMLSWNLWSLEPEVSGESGGGRTVIQTAFLMNILFPAIATVVAMSSVSRHPLETTSSHAFLSRRELVVMFAVCGASLLAAATASSLVKGDAAAPLVLSLGTFPICLWLLATCRGEYRYEGSEELEDALFRTGSRMVDGENFEAALAHAASEEFGATGSTLVRRLAFRTNAAGQDFDRASDEESEAYSKGNAVKALGIVREAASKDEQAAGTLAMDLAVYLRDLRELDSSLKTRLRPTISMMRITAYALGPVVLGVTYAIYMTMSSMMGSGLGGLDSGTFLIILGVFLAETNAAVCYFVWGIEGSETPRRLVRSIGACILASEAVFVATAALAS